MKEKIEQIISNYQDVEIADVEGTNLFAIVYRNKQASEQAPNIAVDINTSCNEEILYSGMVIDDPSDDNICYGLVDRTPDTNILYPTK